MTQALELHPKVSAGLLAGNLTTITLYVLDERWSISPPGTVGAAIAGVFMFLCGWLVPARR